MKEGTKNITINIPENSHLLGSDLKNIILLLYDILDNVFKCRDKSKSLSGFSEEMDKILNEKFEKLFFYRDFRGTKGNKEIKGIDLINKIRNEFVDKLISAELKRQINRNLGKIKEKSNDTKDLNIITKINSEISKIKGDENSNV